MTMKSPFFVLLMFAIEVLPVAAFTSQKKLVPRNRNQELIVRAKELQEWEEDLQKREHSLVIAEKWLYMREKIFLEQEKNLKQMETRLHDRELHLLAQGNGRRSNYASFEGEMPQGTTYIGQGEIPKAFQRASTCKKISSSAFQKSSTNTKLARYIKFSQDLQNQENSEKSAEDKLKTIAEKPGSYGVQIVEKSLESQNASKMKASDKQRIKVESKSTRVEFNKESPLKVVSVFPNESAVKLLRNVKTNKMFWEDENDLIEDRKKAKIEACFQQKGESMANCIFDCVSSWIFNTPIGAHPFVKELLSAVSEDVDVERRCASNRTPLIIASRFDADQAVVRLLRRGAKIEDVDKKGYSAIHWAAAWGGELSCKVLLQNGAKVDDRDNYGDTPLMEAAYSTPLCHERAEVVKFLLDSGADTEIKNKRDKKVLDLSTSNSAKIIRTHKANN